MPDKEKEAIEIIVDTLNIDSRMAQRVLNKLHKIGYRSANYTLISDEDIINIVGGREYGADHLPIPIDESNNVTLRRAKEVAQAQLDHIKEH